MTKKRIYLHPTPVRIWHWLNALGIITLCITGAQIRFPEFLNICGSYRAAILLHNTAGIVVALSFSIWFFYYSQVTHTLAKMYVPDAGRPEEGRIPPGLLLLLSLFLRADRIRTTRRRTISSTRCRSRHIWQSCLCWYRSSA